MAPRPLDGSALRTHKLRNTVHSWMLAGGSILLLVICVTSLMGPDGLLWALVFGGISLAMATRISPPMVLRLYGARPVHPAEFPEGWAILRDLAERAGLPAVPQLYYVPSRVMNAFAVGRPEDSAVAVTDGLIRGLTIRQLRGVLAHEISHVRNGDLKVMALADIVSRMTGVMSAVGLFTLFVNLPYLAAARVPVPWGGVLLLMAAPTIGSLLQLGLSRAREYDADLDAAGLTGDPEGLASALMVLERRQGALWELMMPGAKIPDPSLLRSHPRTEDRVARLMALAGRPGQLPETDDRRPRIGRSIIPVIRPPRWRTTGLWY